MYKIKRYTQGITGDDTPMMYENMNGKYIKYEDFEKFVNKVTKIIKEGLGVTI